MTCRTRKKSRVGLIPVMRGGKVPGLLRLADLFGEISKIALGNYNTNRQHHHCKMVGAGFKPAPIFYF